MKIGVQNPKRLLRHFGTTTYPYLHLITVILPTCYFVNMSEMYMCDIDIASNILLGWVIFSRH